MITQWPCFPRISPQLERLSDRTCQKSVDGLDLPHVYCATTYDGPFVQLSLSTRISRLKQSPDMQAVAQTARRSHLWPGPSQWRVTNDTGENLGSPLAKEPTRLSTDADHGLGNKSSSRPDPRSLLVDAQILSERGCSAKARQPQDSVCNYTQGRIKVQPHQATSGRHRGREVAFSSERLPPS